MYFHLLLVILFPLFTKLIFSLSAELISFSIFGNIFIVFFIYIKKFFFFFSHLLFDFSLKHLKSSFLHLQGFFQYIEKPFFSSQLRVDFSPKHSKTSSLHLLVFTGMTQHPFECKPNDIWNGKCLNWKFSNNTCTELFLNSYQYLYYVTISRQVYCH